MGLKPLIRIIVDGTSTARSTRSTGDQWITLVVDMYGFDHDQYPLPNFLGHCLYRKHHGGVSHCQNTEAIVAHSHRFSIRDSSHKHAMAPIFAVSVIGFGVGRAFFVIGFWVLAFCQWLK